MANIKVIETRFYVTGGPYYLETSWLAIAAFLLTVFLYNVFHKHVSGRLLSDNLVLSMILSERFLHLSTLVIMSKNWIFIRKIQSCAKYPSSAAFEPLIMFQSLFSFHICIRHPLILLSAQISRLAEMNVWSMNPPPHLIFLKYFKIYFCKFKSISY